MNKVKIPEPKIKSHIEQLEFAGEVMDIFTVVAKNYWGRPLPIVYQGEFTPTRLRNFMSMVSNLNDGSWPFKTLEADIKNVVVIMYENKVKLQCNFCRKLSEIAVLDFKKFSIANPNFIYSADRKNSKIEFWIRNIESNRMVSCEF